MEKKHPRLFTLNPNCNQPIAERVRVGEQHMYMNKLGAWACWLVYVQLCPLRKFKTT